MKQNTKEKRKLKLSKLFIIIITLVVIATLMVVIISKPYDNAEVSPNSSTTNNLYKSGKIRYAYIYNIETAESLNKLNDGKYIDILEITLANEEMIKINDLLKDVNYKEIDASMYNQMNQLVSVFGTYEVSLDNMVLLIDPGSKWALYKKDATSFIIDIPETFVNYIDKIVENKVASTVRKFDSEKITIYNKEGKSIDITNPNHIEKLTTNLMYIKVNIKDEDMKNETMTYIVDLNNGIKFTTYHASVIGYMVDSDGTTSYVAFMTDYEDIVDALYETYNSGRNEVLKANKITINYLGKEYIVADKQKVEYVIDSLSLCSYNTYDWLKDFDESDYSDDDIVIEIAKCKVIIPGNKSLGNRYFLDETGKAYMISNFYELESYFKSIVNYK